MSRKLQVSLDDETIAEIAYRVYLMRLDPPLTPEQSAAHSHTVTGGRGKPLVQDDAHRRRNSRCMIPLVRAFVQVGQDLELIERPVGLLG